VSREWFIGTKKQFSNVSYVSSIAQAFEVDAAKALASQN